MSIIEHNFAVPKDFAAAVHRWHFDPANFIDSMFDIKLSNQQRKACDELGKINHAKIMLSEGKELNEEQQRYADYIGVNIPAGMGTGKDFWVSLMITYLMTVFPIEKGQAPHAMATANTSKQLKNVLWRQLSVIPSMSKKNPKTGKPMLEDLFICHSEKFFRKEFDGKSFFCEAITVNPYASSDEQARALTGRHAPYMYIIIDEAAGVPDPVFSNLEGTLTGKINLIIMIYNPIKSRGYPIQACDDEKRWLTLNWNAEETVFDDPGLDIPLQKNVKSLLDTYGRDSNAYRIRALGKPPIMGNDMFFPWDWVQGAVDKGLDPMPDDVTVMGVDPAAGGDNSVIVVRKGQRIVDIQRFTEPDTMRFAEKVAKAYYEWEPLSINIDNIGVGKGVYDRLMQLKLPAYEADFRRNSSNKRKWKLVRDELWSELRERFRRGEIEIPDDHVLLDQLGSMKIRDYSATGIVKIPSKAQMKRDIGYSPDEADAICLSYAIPDEVLLMQSRMPDNQIYDDDDSDNSLRDPVTGY